MWTRLVSSMKDFFVVKFEYFIFIAKICKYSDVDGKTNNEELARPREMSLYIGLLTKVNKKVMI